MMEDNYYGLNLYHSRIMVRFGLENGYDLRASYLLVLTKSLMTTCKSLSIFLFYHVPSSILQEIGLFRLFFPFLF